MLNETPAVGYLLLQAQKMLEIALEIPDETVKSFLAECAHDFQEMAAEASDANQ